MLKDKLTAIAQNPHLNSMCLLGQTMKEMDAETFSAFVRAMGSSASSAQIMEILKEEGLSNFGISHLRDKRRACFKQETECFCLKEINGGK